MKTQNILIIIPLFFLLGAEALRTDSAHHFLFLGPLTIAFLLCMVIALRRDKKVCQKPQTTNERETTATLAYLEMRITEDRNKYLRNTVFNPKFISTTSIVQVFFMLYLATFIALGTNIIPFTVLLALEVGFSIWKLATTYRTWSKWHKAQTSNKTVVLVNKHGIATAIPFRTGKEGRTPAHLLINAYEWELLKKVEIHNNVAKIEAVLPTQNTETSFYIETPNAPVMEELKQRIAEHFPAGKEQKHTSILTISNANDIVMPMVKVRIDYEIMEPQEAHLCDSYLGYLPALPPNVKWPTYHDLPLTLLAQINCATLWDANIENLLPKQGRLLFFYEMKEMLASELGNNGCVRVIYNNSPVKDLKFRTDFTKQGDPRFMINHYPIGFDSIPDLPAYKDACLMNESVAKTNAYTYNYVASDITKDNKKNSIGAIYGYPRTHELRSLLPDDGKEYVLLLETLLDKEAFYGYLVHRDRDDETAKNIKNFYNRWAELPCMLYFFVPKEDLKRLDFSNMRFVRRSRMEDELEVNIPNIGQ